MAIFRCRLEIGKYVFRTFSHIKIESSRKALSDGATIKLPNPNRMLDTNLNVGDKVRIFLGYDKLMDLRFQGYISKLKPNHPFEIECEDEMWTLKRDPVNMSWKSITLKALVSWMIPGADISQLPDATLAPYSIDNATKFKALEQLKEDFGFDIYFRSAPLQVDWNAINFPVSPVSLFCGLAYTDQAVAGNSINYNFNYNIIPRNMELAYTKATDVRLLIKAISVLDDGKTVNAEYGDQGGEIQTKAFYNISDKDILTALAKQEAQKSKFDGYTGSFKTWLVPSPQHGMIANFKDPKYPDRIGSNFIDSITTNVSKQGGGRLEIKPGQKINSITN